MNRFLILIVSAFILFSGFGCEELERSGENRFSLVINDTLIYDSNSIDFYDLSAGLIYLKPGNTFTYSEGGTFSVKVGNEEIYTGNMHPLYYSTWPVGPVIYCSPNLYKDYIIEIGIGTLIDRDGNPIYDPRNDSRIIDALISNNQYKQGLTSEILSVEELSGNRIKITIKLKNMDGENLLILDPDKTGVNLFHYFTNGLTIKDSQNNSYSNNVTPETPEPWNTWENEWLSVIEGYGTKTFSIVYDDFDIIPPGAYTAQFSYPGLSVQVEREELYQLDGRIWLGDLNNTKSIVIQ
jgi:hypothetical protein